MVIVRETGRAAGPTVGRGGGIRMELRTELEVVARSAGRTEEALSGGICVAVIAVFHIGVASECAMSEPGMSQCEWISGCVKKLSNETAQKRSDEFEGARRRIC